MSRIEYHDWPLGRAGRRGISVLSRGSAGRTHFGARESARGAGTSNRQSRSCKYRRDRGSAKPVWLPLDLGRHLDPGNRSSSTTLPGPQSRAADTWTSVRDGRQTARRPLDLETAVRLEADFHNLDLPGGAA